MSPVAFYFYTFIKFYFYKIRHFVQIPLPAADVTSYVLELYNVNLNQMADFDDGVMSLQKVNEEYWRMERRRLTEEVRTEEEEEDKKKDEKIGTYIDIGTFG